MEAFPEGKANAESRFAAVQRLLKINPYIGRPSERLEGAREYRVQHTPFNFLYRLVDDRIEILRVLDTRSGWAGDDDERN